jgi:hypothetical protein
MENIQIDKKVAEELLSFFTTLANKTDNGYIWREACGFEAYFMEVLNIKSTAPNVENNESSLLDESELLF